MPTYEYRCPSGHLTEVFHRIDEEPPRACEVCGEGPLTKVLHPVPVFFKGSGFYSTDYGRGKRKKEAGGEGEPAKSEESVKTVKKEGAKTAEA
ncbi:MAG: FmdB family transcriptional regulator [Thermoleophilia bacterium]